MPKRPDPPPPDRLEKMFEAQIQMASNFIPIKDFLAGKVPKKETQEWMYKYLMCVAEEIFEAARELPIRKFWSKKRDKPVNRDNLLEEMSDIWHFLIAAMLIMGWTEKDLYRAYFAKFHKNNQRLDEKY